MRRRPCSINVRTHSWHMKGHVPSSQLRSDLHDLLGTRCRPATLLARWRKHVMSRGIGAQCNSSYRILNLSMTHRHQTMSLTPWTMTSS
eukprot:5554817-Amphidinium_carterae.2